MRLLTIILLMCCFSSLSSASTGNYECNEYATPPKIFNLVSMNIKSEPKVTVIVKYNCITGRSWFKSGTKWKEIEEGDYFIAQSSYKINITEHSSGWQPIRIDTESGRSWRAVNQLWVENEE